MNAPDLHTKLPVPAVARAARLLDLLTEGPVSLAEAARRLDLPKSSLHGLCTTLQALRLINRHDDGSMSLGPHLMRWSHAFIAQTQITQELFAIWGEINVLQLETLALSVLEGAQVVYLACRNGKRALGVTFRPGMHLTAAYTATGKAILSTYSDAEIEAAFAGTAWPAPMTATSVRSVADLIAEMPAVRRRGYSIDNGQLRDDMTCFGAPVFDSNGGKAIAGVSIGMVTGDVTPALQEQAGTAIRQLADRLSERLGYHLATAGVLV